MPPANRVRSVISMRDTRASEVDPSARTTTISTHMPTKILLHFDVANTRALLSVRLFRVGPRPAIKPPGAQGFGPPQPQEIFPVTDSRPKVESTLWFVCCLVTVVRVHAVTTMGRTSRRH